MKHKYTIKQLMSDSEMLSHIFLTCTPHEKLSEIAQKSGNWQENDYSISVEMKIDGLSINPKSFFDEFLKQYNSMLTKEAHKIVSEQLSDRFNNMSNMLYDYEQIIKSWEGDINWEIENPLLKKI